MKEEKPYATVRISLEPVIDARMRAHCDAQRITYAAFVREAFGHMISTTNKKMKKSIPARRDIYGRLSGRSLTVRITTKERTSIVRYARMMNFKEERSFGRLARYAISLYLSSFDGGSHQEQSPAPASEDTPPPSAS